MERESKLIGSEERRWTAFDILSDLVELSSSYIRFLHLQILESAHDFWHDVSWAPAASMEDSVLQLEFVEVVVDCLLLEDEESDLIDVRASAVWQLWSSELEQNIIETSLRSSENLMHDKQVSKGQSSGSSRRTSVEFAI